jgi:hypothetical protein
MTPLQKLQAMFMAAFKGERKINYIVQGDSLRGNNSLDLLHDYYRRMFAPLNIDVLWGAAPSLKISEWQANISGNAAARLSYCVKNSLGDGGIDTILEINMGINDDTAFTGSPTQKLQTKEAIREAIYAFKNEKPLATLLFVSPQYSGNMSRTLRMRQIYRELAQEFESVHVELSGHNAHK